MDEYIYILKNIEVDKLKLDCSLDEWFYEMVKKKVSELSIKDLSHMLRQEVYLDIAIPIVWEKLIFNPFCGEMYCGQMLELLTRVFIRNPKLMERGKYEILESKIQSLTETYVWEDYNEEKEFEQLMNNLRLLYSNGIFT